MTLLKQSDGKIITNLGGEILTVPPIVDLRSNYGVTKDGSNLVSSVKLFGGAKKAFQTDAAYKPIENGDGFEIATDENLYLANSPEHDYFNYTNYTWELWVKAGTLDATYRRIFGNRPASGSIGCIMFFIDSATTFSIVTQDNNGTIISNIAHGLSINEWSHVLIVKEGTRLSVYIKGVYRATVNTLSRPATVSADKMSIGNAHPYAPGYQNFSNGKIYSFRIYTNNALHKYNAGYVTGQQVFTSPIMY